MSKKETDQCATCCGRGIVDVGTCPDCLGSGDELTDQLAFERFINQHVAQRDIGGPNAQTPEIEGHVLEEMWDKMLPWAQAIADDHGSEDETLDFDENELCGRNECGGCGENEPPCEAYKLWLAGMLLARALRAEASLRKRIPSPS